MSNNNEETKRVIAYTAPEGARLSSDVRVFANGVELSVYETAVNRIAAFSFDPTCESAPFVSFDFEGGVEVEVEYPKEVESAVVRPLAAGVVPSVEGKKVSFVLTRTGDYVLELNGSVDGALHVFTNAPEKDAPKPGDENVIYIAPGYHEERIRMKDGQTLYLAPGAVLSGQVVADGVKNVEIRGRGIIDGRRFRVWTDRTGPRNVNPVIADNCENVVIRDIILVDPNAWVLNACNTQNLLISRVKIISARCNGDGITLQSCRNARVVGCFVRSWDDSLVVKNYKGNTENMIFEDCLIWTDLAQSMEIGYETNKGRRADSHIRNVKFRNITVLHNFHKPVISIHNADECEVCDISYENIIVEDAEMGGGDAGDNKQLIDFVIAKNANWSATASRGITHGISIKNVKVLSGVFPPSRFAGFDESHRVSDVTIENLVIFGRRITNAGEGLFEINEFTDNIVIK